MHELEILRQHAAGLMGRANVIGLGIGYKIRQGHRLSRHCLTVLVSEKKPVSALGLADVIPARIGGMLTDVVASGQLKPLQQTERMRPARPGLSISHYRVTAGTFGCVVYDRSSGETLILSNNHVLANSSGGRDRRANMGDPILQPGSHDGGTPDADVIARLERYIPLHFVPWHANQAKVASLPTNWYLLAEKPSQAVLNLVDAAVAKPLQPGLVDADILGIGPVAGTTEGELDLKVQKSGRTTGYTTGTILIRNVVLRVDYGPAGVCIYTNQLVSDIESAPGDSGSLVLDMEGNAVGLLFAGGEGITVINPIADVMQQLDIVFAK